jgi:hypothetical protein
VTSARVSGKAWRRQVVGRLTATQDRLGTAIAPVLATSLLAELPELGRPTRH